MTYVLEKIAPEDRERIIEDAGCDPAKKRDLVHASRYPRDFPKTWAVDRERSAYLYFAPVLVRPESMGTSLYFFFEGILYEIRVETPFGNEVSIVAPPQGPQSHKVQEELVSAFAVFGRYSTGPLNEFGHPEFAFVPEFKKVM